MTSNPKLDNIPYAEINRLAESYRKDISAFLRSMIRLPSESCNETMVIQHIKAEMIHVGFDRVDIDGMGNVIGYMGSGDVMIAMDAHIDTVGVGEVKNWEYDPYEGFEDDEVIVGRGASDQEGGMASMVYGAKIMKELGLLEGVTLIITGTVQEEDCDGLCWQYMIEKGGLKPEFVVITEPTSLNIYRGQRGRMEILVETSGVSCHGSAPERGDNAIYKMAPIISDLKALHTRLLDDPFLGKGSLAVSEIFYSSPSRCAVADGCSISVDRRLTDGETYELALEQIRALPSVVEADAKVSMYRYDRPAYTGLVYPTDCFFPTWVLPEEHDACQTMVSAFKGLFDKEPLVDKWTFSTNGVAIMGRYGIPCIGFGPGHEDQAHAPNEKTWKNELVAAAALYAAMPAEYMKRKS